MGLRSAHGAFVDMVGSGFQSGGRLNGAEIKAVDQKRLDAVGRHRCIHSRLAHVPHDCLAVLRAIYGPDDWTRAIGDPEVRGGVEAIFAHLKDQTHRVLPLTAEAVSIATSKASRALVDAFSHHGTRGRPPKRAKPLSVATDAAVLRRRVADYLRVEGIANGPIGVVLIAAVAEDRKPFQRMVEQATALLTVAQSAACVAPPQPRHGVRVCRNRQPEGAHAR